MDLYIGEFPAPYNGVSVKNSLLYSEIYSRNGMKILDVAQCKRNPWLIPIFTIKLILGLLLADHIIVGVGSDLRRKIILILRRLLKGNVGLHKTVMVSMGGRLHKIVANDPKYLKQLSYLGCILVETNEIAEGLHSLGLFNVKIVPNCRTLEGEMKPKCVGEKVKFVYFSVICEEKGMDEVISAVEEINDGYSLDIYGEVVERYRGKFYSFLEKHADVKYKGVFDSTSGNVYKELNQYDVMLFPSRWVGEGVPGALVESKIAGITAIVSDWNFNKEVVRDLKEGIVIKNRLKEDMEFLIANKEILMQLKEGAFASRSRYSINTYKNELLSCIEGK